MNMGKEKPTCVTTTALQRTSACQHVKGKAKARRPDPTSVVPHRARLGLHLKTAGLRARKWVCLFWATRFKFAKESRHFRDPPKRETPRTRPSRLPSNSWLGARWLAEVRNPQINPNQQLAEHAGTVFQSTGNKDATFGQKAQTTGPY